MRLEPLFLAELFAAQIADKSEKKKQFARESDIYMERMYFLLPSIVLRSLLRHEIS